MGRQLDAQSAEFDERNLFLFLSLGLLSLGDRLENLLRRHVPERMEVHARDRAVELEPLAYLALGAIHMRNVIRRELYSASAETSGLGDVACSDDVGAPVGDVLR